MRLPRVPARTYRWICAATLVVVAAIVITGAAVRLTNSGLGCSDWPSCSQTQFVSVSGFHRSIEQINRLFTGAISVTIILAVLGSLARVPRRRDLVWWSLGLVGGLVAQIVLGGISVKLKLSPPTVMAHYLLSAVLVWNAIVLFDRSGRPEVPAPEVPDREAGDAAVMVPGSSLVGARERQLSRAMVAVAGAVLVTGTVVTGTGPHGGDQNVRRLPYQVEDVARIHSLTAWALLALTLVTLGLVYRAGTTSSVRARGMVLTGAILVQGALGYTQYFLGVPPGLVIVHVAGSVAVWGAVLWFHLGLTEYRSPAVPYPEPTG